MGTEETPVVIEVALTTNPTRNPNTGGTVAEVVEQGLACMDAGASIVHMHLPDLGVPAAEATRQYLEYFTPWLERDPDVLVLPTNGSGDTLAEKFGHQWAAPRRRGVAVGLRRSGCHRLRLARSRRRAACRRATSTRSTTTPCPTPSTRARQRGMGMHFACFEPGWLRNVLAYWRAGRLSRGLVREVLLRG